MNIEIYTFETQKKVMELQGTVLEREQLDIISRLTETDRNNINSWIVVYKTPLNSSLIYETSNLVTNRTHVNTLRTSNLEKALFHANPWNQNTRGIKKLLITSKEI